MGGWSAWPARNFSTSATTRLEPRAGEGFHSPRGLLFYVQGRPEAARKYGPAKPDLGPIEVPLAPAPRTAWEIRRGINEQVADTLQEGVRKGSLTPHHAAASGRAVEYLWEGDAE